MEFVELLITPEMASDFLSQNDHNRKISKERVESYASDMKDGRWDVTHQCIAIGEDGSIVDGQHRLCAIVKSGCSVKSMVAFNAPRSINLDSGMTRNMTASFYMAGKCDKNDVRYNSTFTSAARTILAIKTGCPRVSKSAVYQFMTDNLETFETLSFIINKPGVRTTSITPGLKTASVYAALFMALKYGEDKEALKAWYQIASTGEYEGSVARGVMYFRNFLFTQPRQNGGSGYSPVIGKAMYSIKHFCDSDPVTQVRYKIYYPITEEIPNT